MDKKMCNDYLAIVWKNSAKIIRGIMFGASVLMFIYAIYSFAAFGLQAFGTFISTLVIGGVAMFLSVAGYKLQSKSYFMKQSSDWGGDTYEKTIYFYKDSFKQEAPKGAISFEYDKIEDFIIGKNIYVVKVAGGSLIIQRDGFTKGDSNAFADFMWDIAKTNKEKMPAAKQKKK